MKKITRIFSHNRVSEAKEDDKNKENDAELAKAMLERRSTRSRSLGSYLDHVAEPQLAPNVQAHTFDSPMVDKFNDADSQNSNDFRTMYAFNPDAVDDNDQNANDFRTIYEFNPDLADEDNVQSSNNK